MDNLEEGIKLTPEAVASVHYFQEKFSMYRGKPLRLYIEGKGCDGFFYGVTFDDAKPDDMKFQSDGIEIHVDADSYKYLKGSTITWHEDEKMKGFLVENPNHNKFRGKFYKKKSWIAENVKQ